MTRSLSLPARLIALFAITYAVAATVFFRTQLYAAHPDVVAWGITFDLTITIPLLWYAFVVRRGHARLISLVPVFVVCSVVASRIVPLPQHHFIDQLRWLAVPLDLVTLWLAVRSLDRSSFAVRVAAGEAEALYFALFCWRKKRADGFTFHERSGWGSMVACILVLLTAESIGVHLLLLHYSAKAAWILALLDVYGMLWFVGDYHAMRLRTTTVDDRALHFRFGLRWSAIIERTNIAAIEEARDWKRKDVIKAALLDDPKLLIRFREPVVATGPFGIRRTITALALLPDDVDGFVRALT